MTELQMNLVQRRPLRAKTLVSAGFPGAARLARATFASAKISKSCEALFEVFYESNNAETGLL